MSSSFSSSSPYLYLSLFLPVSNYLSVCLSVCLCLFISVFLPFRRNLQMLFRSKCGQTVSDGNIISVHSQKKKNKKKKQTRKHFLHSNNARTDLFCTQPILSEQLLFKMSELGHCNKEVSSGSAKTGRGSGYYAHTEQVDRFLHGAAILSLIHI